MAAKVYFIPLPDGVSEIKQAEAISRIFDVAGAKDIICENDFVAIKTHVGEKNNVTHIRPELIRELVQKVRALGGQPFLTETSTLYVGERENAVKHILHAQRHGFGIENVGAPFIMADGLAGNTEYEVTINGELHEKVKIAKEVETMDALLVVTHATGHMITGLGACIKNMGMGLASRKAKMRQHSAMKPAVKPNTCTFCKKCSKWCPMKAIGEKNGKAYIDSDACIGCGECMAICNFNAIKYDYNAEMGFTQRSMVEHAYGVVKEKFGKIFFFTVMVNMTEHCDCLSISQKKLIPDIGILASTDPVAIDMATLDLTAKANGLSLAEKAFPEHNAMIQIEHAVKIGMGSREYELIKF